MAARAGNQTGRAGVHGSAWQDDGLGAQKVVKVCEHTSGVGPTRKEGVGCTDCSAVIGLPQGRDAQARAASAVGARPIFPGEGTTWGAGCVHWQSGLSRARAIRRWMQS
jgi:hypothetical protein